MTLDETVSRLRSLGTAQARKIYARHGVRGDQFGVSYAEMGKLKKAIKTDHALATGLWASGIHDARVLATMIADPARMSVAELSKWAKDLPDCVLAGALAGLAAQVPGARDALEGWLNSDNEWVGSFAWTLLSQFAGQEGPLTDAECERHLKTIEAGIHTAKNRVRYSMNGAVIAIGLRNAKLKAKALAAAARIGKVDVDHGETSCETPAAADYIRKTKAHRAKQQAAKSKRAKK
jgi:3-methyladenine DNA glycosylase AlkD